MIQRKVMEMFMKKGIFVSVMLALVISPIFSPLKSAQAGQSSINDVIAASSDSIPLEVIEKAYSKVHRTLLPEVKVYEKNENNEWLLVPNESDLGIDNSEIVLKKHDPEKGFTYTFNRYEPDYVKRDWHYDVVSVYRCENGTSKNIKAKYVLESSRTTTASVSASISATAEIKAAFLAKLEATIGFSGGYEKTWNEGWSASVEATVEPNTIAYITNYQVGVNASGAIVYDKRTPEGQVCGIRRETAGGTVISKSDINIEVTSKTPTK